VQLCGHIIGLDVYRRSGERKGRTAGARKQGKGGGEKGGKKGSVRKPR